MKAQRIVSTTLCLVMVSLCVFAVLVTTAKAQDDAPAAEEAQLFDWIAIARDIILVVVFSIIGLIILMIGYKVFDMATPYDSQPKDRRREQYCCRDCSCRCLSLTWHNRCGSNGITYPIGLTQQFEIVLYQINVICRARSPCLAIANCD